MNPWRARCGTAFLGGALEKLFLAGQRHEEFAPRMDRRRTRAVGIGRRANPAAVSEARSGGSRIGEMNHPCPPFLRLDRPASRSSSPSSAFLFVSVGRATPFPPRIFSGAPDRRSMTLTCPVYNGAAPRVTARESTVCAPRTPRPRVGTRRRHATRLSVIRAVLPQGASQGCKDGHSHSTRAEAEAHPSQEVFDEIRVDRKSLHQQFPGAALGQPA